jgi:hypothetical protein
MSEWEELKNRDFWKSAWGLDRTQSAGQRIREFCVTALFASVILFLVVSILQGLFEHQPTWEDYCEDSPSFCE